MALRKPPSGRDCALAQAALEKLKASELRPLSGLPSVDPVLAMSASDETIQRHVAALDGFASLAMSRRSGTGADVSRGAIRLIDLERRARFARVAS
jgi:hypothetical protein